MVCSSAECFEILLFPEIFGGDIFGSSFVHSLGEIFEVLGGSVLVLVSGGLLVLSKGLAGTSLGLSVFFSLLSSLFIEFSFGSSSDSGVWVKSVHESGVVEGVLLLNLVEDGVVSSGVEFGLNLVGVDDSGDIGVGEDRSLESVSVLFSGAVSLSTEDVVEGSEGAFSPDDKATELASGGEFEEVESVDVGDGDSGDVSEGLGEFDIFSADDNEGTSAGGVSVVSHLASAGSEGAGGDDSLDVVEGADSAEPGDGILGSLNVLDGVVEHEGQLVDVVYSVTAGLDEGHDGGGSDGGAHSVTLLGHVNATVPSSPGLQRGEHATLSAHVTEGTLA